MNKQDKWHDLAQGGLAYTKDKFDKERFERIREISAEIISLKNDLLVEKVLNLFCNETGFQTPKLDSKKAVFKGNKILLVQEYVGRWSLPGGWVDVNAGVMENLKQLIADISH